MRRLPDKTAHGSGDRSGMSRVCIYAKERCWLLQAVAPRASSPVWATRGNAQRDEAPTKASSYLPSHVDRVTSANGLGKVVVERLLGTATLDAEHPDTGVRMLRHGCTWLAG